MKANRYHVIDCTQWLPPLVLHDRHQYDGDKQAKMLTSTKNKQSRLLHNTIMFVTLDTTL